MGVQTDPVVDPDTGLPVAAAPAAQPTQAAEPVVATPAPTPAPAAEGDEDKWQHKYFTLKGMFDAEVPRLHAQVKELTTQMTNLTNQLNTRPAAPAPTPTPLVTDKDRESFGPDLVDLIDRGVRQATAPLLGEIEKLRAANAQLAGSVQNTQQTTQKTADQVFYGKLKELVPDVSAVNVDPKFMAWLQEVDPIYGLPRQVALNNAHQNKDANRVANIFNTFKQLNAPAAAPSPSPTPQRDPKKELARQVPPARTNTSNEPVVQPKIQWTQESIARFYEDCRRGALSPEDQLKYEADLQSAIAEGRVS